MNVDRRGWVTSAVRGRILAAAVVLIGAACVLLGVGSPSGQTGTATVAPVPTLAASLSVPNPVSLQDISSRQGGAQVRAHSLLSGMPLRFEPNQGQGNLDSAAAALHLSGMRVAATFLAGRPTHLSL